MGKDIASLRQSREFRTRMKHKYGFIPSTVWDIRTSFNKDLIYEMEGRKQFNISDTRQTQEVYKDPDMKKAFSMSSRTIRGTSENSGFSTFPPELAKKITLFYSERGDTVLDCFLGHVSRMQTVHNLDRHYIGYDISKKYCEFAREVAEKLQSGLVTNNSRIIICEKNSENIHEADDSVDLIFTSPPYYKLEYYTDEPEQLYFSDSYEHFLSRMKIILAQCYRVLKKDKFCVFNVNDFRYKGLFYTYHSDIITLMKEVGFKMHDVVIVKWTCSLQTVFASQIEKNKICGKIHEFLIVGKK